MAKKNFTSGIDALLTSIITKYAPGPEQVPDLQQESGNAPAKPAGKFSGDDKLVFVSFRMPESLVMKMRYYCVDNP
ncbi:MAG: hypothetical protein LBV72_12865 [Tannerella sp.]|jgi:hypothetical protein|nr:hypothetical protein [Tannerella sp.]